MPAGPVLRNSVVALCAAAAAGCTPTAFHRDALLRPTPGDWPAYGGGMRHENYSADAPVAPLRAAWDAELPSGAGRAAPIVAESLLIVPQLAADVQIYNPMSGKKIGYITTDGSLAASPALFYNKIIFTAEQGSATLASYDVNAGEYVWKRDVGWVVAPALVRGDTIITASVNGTVDATEAVDGLPAWRYFGREEFRVAPIDAGGAIIVAGVNGELIGLAPTTGRVRWRSRLGAVMAPLVADDSTVFVASRDSTLRAIRAIDGVERWRFRSTAPFAASPALGPDALCAVSVDGRVAMLRRSDGGLVWAASAGGPVSAAPLATPSLIYIARIDGRLLALDARSGTERWSAWVKGRVYAPPVAWNGRLFIVDDHRFLTAFREDR